MPKKIEFPFDLPKAPESFFIAVPPVICKLMCEGTTEEQSTISLIAPKLEQKGDEWGLLIPRHFGFSAPEMQQIKANAQTERDMSLRSLRVLKTIADETGKETGEIFAEASKLKDGDFSQAPDWLLKYGEQLIDAQAPMDRDFGREKATLYLQRVMPNWTRDNTDALHPRILEQVYKFDDLESEAIAVEGNGSGEMTPTLIGK